MVRVLGIDAWSKGWVGIELIDGVFAGAQSAATLEALIGSSEYHAVTVDMPLGLMERTGRRADSACAALLGPRRSSVFPTPPRLVLLEESFAAANARHRELTGKGLSQQSYALKERLLEADMLYSSTHGPLYEVHPEMSFTTMSGTPPAMSKKTWHGQRDRTKRLQDQGIDIPADIGDASAAAADDVLDAAAAAWSAHRIATGVSQSVPNPPEENERGQQSAIWY